MDLIENPSLFAIGLIGFLIMISATVHFKFKSEKRMKELSFESTRYRLDQEWIEADQLHGYCEILSVVFLIIGLIGFLG